MAKPMPACMVTARGVIETPVFISENALGTSRSALQDVLERLGAAWRRDTPTGVQRLPCRSVIRSNGQLGHLSPESKPEGGVSPVKSPIRLAS